MSKHINDNLSFFRFVADVGVPPDQIGSVLSQCPNILEETEQDLKTRVAYLVSKKFTLSEIGHIISCSPSWLCHNVRSIDSRLGFFQKTFDFSGDEGRVEYGE